MVAAHGRFHAMNLIQDAPAFGWRSASLRKKFVESPVLPCASSSDTRCMFGIRCFSFLPCPSFSDIRCIFDIRFHVCHVRHFLKYGATCADVWALILNETNLFHRATFGSRKHRTNKNFVIIAMEDYLERQSICFSGSKSRDKTM